MIYWILTTQRSGSNFFCEQLARTGASAMPREFLAPSFIPPRMKEFTWREDAPIESFLEYIHEQVAKKRPIGIKLLYPQFELASRYHDLAEAIRSRKVIYLYRANVIKQGISLYIGHHTKRWESRGPASETDISDIPYDFDEINSRIKRLEVHNAQWRRLLSTINPDYVELRYEDALENRNTAVDRVLKHLGLTGNTEKEEHKPLFESQTTRKNFELYFRFVADQQKIFFSGELARRRPEPELFPREAVA